ncbi:leucine-rich repeat-containing protein 34 isoform X2 [Artibeus jamaicensis]|uniref:leucine-rich repeat-containing protein 34 isoform X2 n=1 Tax=Artibeus jamaicensis TaxID=9417 RepID=UPI00235B2A47|nr:leucine-rich repeat-containing protein 34 isoform X2 [Artibeus jamaicensis]
MWHNKEKTTEARTPLPPQAPMTSRTPTPARAEAVGSAPEPVGSLQNHYHNLCMEKFQKINPFLLHTLQGVDEEIKKGLTGITLNIAGNSHSVPVERVTGEHFWILSKILEKNLSINGLDVRYNLISDVGAYYAARLLQKQHSLIYLNLMFNDIGPKGGELIAKALHKNTTLKYLRMTGNKVENEGGMFFAAMLQINLSLEKLDLGDCDLGMQSVIAFSTALTQNQTIKGINLNRPILYGEQARKSGLDPVGKLHLGDRKMSKNVVPTLKASPCSLTSSNKITRDGIISLADVLKSNTTLEVIDLSFNRIENVGAQKLSETLASHNRSLKALSVVSNSIEGEGLVALSQSMKTNTTLSNIYIWGNKFDEATCVAYSDLIQTGRLKPDNTDVEPYVVDGHAYLAEVSNGLKKYYYWTPTYGDACSLSSNAGFSIVPVGKQL